MEEKDETIKAEVPRRLGRPPGKRREKHPGRMVYIPDDLWNVALAQDGGASVFIRRLLREFCDRSAFAEDQHGKNDQNA